MSITRVAKLAGVSSSTVSRVINNHPRVAPETADSVRKVMAKIGYTPSANRPGPKPANRVRPQSDPYRFAVLGGGVRPGQSSPGFEQLMQGIANAIAKHNAELTFISVPDSADAFEQRLQQARVNGIFTHGFFLGPIRSKLVAYPCMTLMGNRRRPDFGDQVMQDPYAVGELAARYLMDRGHKLLCFFNMDSSHWAIHLYGHAFEATAQAGGARVLGLETERRTAPDVHADFGAEAVEKLVRSYLALPERPTGIFVAEDAQTALLQPALQRAGVELGPGKVEIVSCNNERPYLMGLSPFPATIDIRIPTISARGVEQLVRRVEDAGASLEERVITLIQPRMVLPEAGEG